MIAGSKVGVFQKQLSSDALKNRCSENVPQIYRRTPMPKCDFSKIAMMLMRKSGKSTKLTSHNLHYILQFSLFLC